MAKDKKFKNLKTSGEKKSSPDKWVLAMIKWLKASKVWRGLGPSFKKLVAFVLCYCSSTVKVKGSKEAKVLPIKV